MTEESGDMDHSKHFKSFLLEFAAIVFLLITIEIWLPIAIALAMGGLVIVAIGVVLLLMVAMCSASKADLLSHLPATEMSIFIQL